MTSLRFLFDGKRINDDETPKQVNWFFNFDVELMEKQCGNLEDLLKLYNF